MGWNPSPIDSRGAWGKYEFCVLGLDSGMMGGPELNLINRLLTDSIWSSVGPSDGNVYMSENWAADVANAGGFDKWLAPILAEVNKRMAASCAALDPSRPALTVSAPSGNPGTWPDFRAWFKANAKWTGDSPTPPPPGDTIWGDRRFLNGFAFEWGYRVGADGKPAAIKCRYMEPNVGWRDLPIG